MASDVSAQQSRDRQREPMQKRIRDRMRRMRTGDRTTALQHLIAEFVASAIYAFISAGAFVIVRILARDPTAPSTATQWFYVSMAHGWALSMTIVFAHRTPHTHVHPAISLALASVGRSPFRLLPYQLLGQFTGAVCGAGLTILVFGMKAAYIGQTGSVALHHGVTLWQGFMTEGSATGILMLVMMGSRIKPMIQEQWNWLVLGTTVIALAEFIGPATGGSINPARAFGPDFVNIFVGVPDNWNMYLVVYLAGPVFGCIGAAQLYERVVKPKQLERMMREHKQLTQKLKKELKQKHERERAPQQRKHDRQMKEAMLQLRVMPWQEATTKQYDPADERQILLEAQRTMERRYVEHLREQVQAHRRKTLGEGQGPLLPPMEMPPGVRVPSAGREPNPSERKKQEQQAQDKEKGKDKQQAKQKSEQQAKKQGEEHHKGPAEGQTEKQAKEQGKEQGREEGKKQGKEEALREERARSFVIWDYDHLGGEDTTAGSTGSSRPQDADPTTPTPEDAGRPSERG